MNQHTVDTPPGEPVTKPVVWTSMRTLEVDPVRMERNRIVAFNRTDPAAMAFDMLRTSVMRSMDDDGWRTLGITSPGPGCGKATVAVNLALSLAKQPDLRVVLVDLDLRRPRIAAMLDHSPACTTREFLSEGWMSEEFFVRVDANLAVGASAESIEHPAELLLSKRTEWKLKRLLQGLGASIVIYNLPPLLSSDDCAGLLPLVDRVLLVVGAEHSTIPEIDMCERDLSEEEKLLGVVLNKCRYKTRQYNNYQV